MPIVNTGYSVFELEDHYNKLLEKFKVLFPNMSLNDSNVLIVILRTLALQEYKNDISGSERYNNVYVSTASGVHLDKAVKLAGISRIRGTKSTGKVTITGDKGTAIAPNFEVKNNTSTFVTTNTNTVYIETDSVDVEVQAKNVGLHGNATIGSVNKVASPTIGIKYVTNKEQLTGGTNKETDAQLRARYFEEITSHKGSSLQGMIEYVKSNTSASFVSGRENTSILEVEGMPPKSFEITVEGGTEKEIAESIFFIKPAGIESTGTITHNIDYYQKIYPIKFSRASPKPVYYTITLTVDTSPFDDYKSAEKIKAALQDYSRKNGVLERNKIIGIIYKNSEGISSIDTLKFDVVKPPINEASLKAGFGERFNVDENDISIVY